MDFQQYVQKAEAIQNEVARELGFPEDKKLAGRVLRAVLHTLRQRLTIQESFQMLAQFPMMLKAIYVDGWKYSEKPTKIKNVGEFVKEVIRQDGPTGHFDITTAKDGENVIRAVLKVIRNYVSDGEVQDILDTMPKDLRPLWGPQVQPA